MTKPDPIQAAQARVVIAVADTLENHLPPMSEEARHQFLAHLAEGIPSLLKETASIWCYNRAYESTQGSRRRPEGG